MNPHDLPDINLFHHSIPLQLRFNDIDSLGHVNNTVYFSFFDTGKAHFFQSIMNGGINWREVETVIANIDCAYIQSIFFGENIRLYTRCSEIKEKSFRLQQMMVEQSSGAVKAICETVMVSIDTKTMKSIEIPARWRRALEDSMKE